MKKFFLCFILFVSNAQAREIIQFVRSSKALLMGDAYTSIANDDFTLFYNVGALGENEGINIFPLNPYAMTTNLIKEEDRDRINDIDRDDVDDIVNSLLDFPVFGSAGINPGLKLGKFGFNVVLNRSGRINIRNATHPNAEIITYYDRGVVAGYAIDFKSSIGHTSVGLSAKYIWRDGLDGIFDIYESSIYDQISDPDCGTECLKNTFGYSSGNGWGWDMGLLHVTKFDENSQFRFGLSFLDIGDTTFSGGAPKQEMLINTGISYLYRNGSFNWTLSFDLHPINGLVDFGRQIHFGGEIGFDIFQVMAGFNGGYFSFGAELDFKFIKAIAGIYDVEIGGGYRNQQAKRMLLYLGILDLEFE
jgi:hypothetical protein